MALKPDLISFFLTNIQGSNMKTFGSEVAHLFEHLVNEIKDNQVFDKYQAEREKWANWPGENSFGRWQKFAFQPEYGNEKMPTEG